MDLFLIFLINVVLICLTLFYFFNFSANHRTTKMNLPEPISIKNVDSTQNQLNGDYDIISDSDYNDSKEDFEDCSTKPRIIYSRVS